MAPQLLSARILLVLLMVVATAPGLAAWQPPTASVGTTTRLDATKRTSSSTSSRSRTINPLLEWSKQESVGIQKDTALELQEEGPESGLGWCLGKSAKSSLLCTVPLSTALTVQDKEGPDDASVGPAWGIDRKVLTSWPWYVQMSLYLNKLDLIDSTASKSDSMDYGPWLAALPRQFDTLIHWSPAEREALQYQFAVEAVARQERQWKSLYDQVVAVCKSNQSLLSWEAFLWGCEVARSRAFSGYAGSAFQPSIYVFTLFLITAYVGLSLGTLEQAANGAAVVVSASILKDFVVPKLTKTSRQVICPLIDMTNHDAVGANAVVSFEYFGNAYSLALSDADKDNKDATTVLISYGPRSNDQWLQYYGFVEANNPHDVYVMPPLKDWDLQGLEAACGRKVQPGRLEKLNRAGLLGTTVAAAADQDVGSDTAATNLAGGVVLTRATGMDPAVLQAIRALFSSQEEWETAAQAVGNFCEPLSAANEAVCKVVAATAIQMELDAKPTTLDQDVELFKTLNSKMQDVSARDRLAVQFRIEKKKLLKEVMGGLR